jgi:hypothetical protein
MGGRIDFAKKPCTAEPVIKNSVGLAVILHLALHAKLSFAAAASTRILGVIDANILTGMTMTVDTNGTNQGKIAHRHLSWLRVIRQSASSCEVFVGFGTTRNSYPRMNIPRNEKSDPIFSDLQFNILT